MPPSGVSLSLTPVSLAIKGVKEVKSLSTSEAEAEAEAGVNISILIMISMVMMIVVLQTCFCN